MIRKRRSVRSNPIGGGRRTPLRLLPPLLLAAVVAWAVYPRGRDPLALTYEVDLAGAPQGRLTITLILAGRLPQDLDLDVVGADPDNPSPAARIHSALAASLATDGTPLAPLQLTGADGRWRLRTDGCERAGVIYQVDLDAASAAEDDVRRHLSSPVAGGVRAAGFEVFLQPRYHRVGGITVAVHNPGRLPCVIPWPALVTVAGGEPQPAPERLIQPANLAFAMGYRPQPPAAGPDAAPIAARRDAYPVPANLLYHPRDLTDLNNSLLICGNIVTATDQARDCVIQFATDRQWLFPVQRAVDLVRGVARTQIGFFGSAPTSQITVLLTANPIAAPGSFDAYGAHTGSSVLVMTDPAVTWEQFQENVAGVIAHEMFHGWVGEAIPQSDPSTLWFTEGTATWFAARMLTAGGIWSPAHAREVLQGKLQRDYLDSPLRGRLTPAKASAEVMADPQVVRYAYASALACCLALDEWLTARTQAARPLDEVLRRLYEKRDGTPLDRYLLQEAVLEVTGVDCEAWLQDHVYGKRPPAAPRSLI